MKTAVVTEFSAAERQQIASSPLHEVATFALMEELRRRHPAMLAAWFEVDVTSGALVCSTATRGDSTVKTALFAKLDRVLKAELSAEVKKMGEGEGDGGISVGV